MGSRASGRAVSSGGSNSCCGSDSRCGPNSSCGFASYRGPRSHARICRPNPQAARPHRCVGLQEHSLEEMIAHSTYGLE